MVQGSVVSPVPDWGVSSAARRPGAAVSAVAGFRRAGPSGSIFGPVSSQ